jgi:hypothetical protein
MDRLHGVHSYQNVRRVAACRAIFIGTENDRLGDETWTCARRRPVLAEGAQAAMARSDVRSSEGIVRGQE